MNGRNTLILIQLLKGTQSRECGLEDNTSSDRFMTQGLAGFLLSDSVYCTDSFEVLYCQYEWEDFDSLPLILDHFKPQITRRWD